jgi:hypothetical protein
MDMDNAASILAGTILTGLAIIIAVITVVVINNIISKYWKPVKWVKYDNLPPRFVSQEELDRISPSFDLEKSPVNGNKG